MTRAILLVLLVAMLGCGGGKTPATGPSNKSTPTEDTRTQLQIRQGAACEELGPRLTACAVADARATMTAEELAKLDLEQTSAVHTEEFIRECKAAPMSSRQVRVYEVCAREETACEPLLACLDHVNASAAP